jgi:hypothetical protein
VSKWAPRISFCVVRILIELTLILDDVVRHTLPTYIYRVIQEESARLWEMIVCVILSKKVHMNMGPILNGYRDCERVAVPCNAFTSALRLVAASLQFVMRCARRRRARVLSIADHQ